MLPAPFTVFLAAVGKAAGDRGGREVANVLRELLGLQKAQEELLKQVDIKLDTLLQRPYETGRRQLRDALANWRDADDRRDLLKDARRSFMEAQEHPAPTARSLASMHLAAVWAALNSPQDVRASLREAHIEALRGVEVERRRGETGVRKLGRFMDSKVIAASKPRAVIPLANHIAMARRDWGEPQTAAPIVVGFAYPVRPPSDLRPVEQARWLILNTGSWGLSVGGVEYSKIPLEQRSAESDEVVKWVNGVDRDEGMVSHSHIQSWLERATTAS